MSSNRIWTSIILLFFSFSVFSQIDSTRRDSIEEIIIYEYDTIYIQPDTIRITDTIFDIIKTDSLKIAKPKKSKRARRGRNDYLMKGFLPRSLGFSVATFTYVNPQTLSDTLSPDQVFNMAYHFRLNYYTNKYLVSYGLAYTSYHERYSWQGTSYSSSQDKISTNIYDSIRVTNNFQVEYYYYYLSLDLMLGRKFVIGKKLNLNLNLGVSAGFLIGYKQGNTAVSDSMVRKTDFSLIFSPELTYKINRKFEFKISPFYQHAILEERRYPYMFRQRAGIQVGFNFIF